jgi:hypothetical protein
MGNYRPVISSLKAISLVGRLAYLPKSEQNQGHCSTDADCSESNPGCDSPSTEKYVESLSFLALIPQLARYCKCVQRSALLSPGTDSLNLPVTGERGTGAERFAQPPPGEQRSTCGTANRQTNCCDIPLFKRLVAGLSLICTKRAVHQGISLWAGPTSMIA